MPTNASNIFEKYKKFIKDLLLSFIITRDKTQFYSRIDQSYNKSIVCWLSD